MKDNLTLPAVQPFVFHPLVQVLCGLAVGVGALSFGTSLEAEPERVWSAFAINHFYFMSLAIGGLFFASLQWLTSAMWSAPVRRFSEALTAYLPVTLITFGILTWGLSELYPWVNVDLVEKEPLLYHKVGYLNVSFFQIRNILILLLWLGFAKVMVHHSVKQDLTRDPRHSQINRALCPLFLILFAVTYTVVSFDQMMSLDPYWFSTIFGVYCFAGLFYSTLAVVTLLALFFRHWGGLRGLIREDHLHDLGKFLFAFAVFWAYIGFSQFMLIWYANLPEETGYFIRRLQGHWRAVSLFLLLGKFLVPFLFLMGRTAKRSPRLLGALAAFMLIAHGVDVLWMVQPQFFEEGPVFGWIELGLSVGFLGAFCFCVLFFLSRVSPVPVGDPHLPESVFHHHQ